MIGIDIGSGYVKVVALQRRGGKIRVAGAGVSALPVGGSDDGAVDPSAVARAIRNALDSVGLRHPSAMCGLPRHALIARLVSIPGTPSPQAAQAALVEAARTLPFSAAEVVTGVRMWSHGEGETLALAAAARADMVASYRAAISSAGVKLQGLGMGSLGAAAAAGYTGAEPWILLDIGARSVCMDVVAEGAPRYTRATMSGGEDLTRAFAADLGCDEERAEEIKRSQGLGALGQHDPGARAQPYPATESWLDQLATEVRLLASAHASRGGDAPAGIRLAGGGAALAGLSTYLERAIGLRVELVLPDGLLEARVENPAQYAGAYGMALASAGQVETVDLLAAEVRAARAHRKRRVRAWSAAVVLALALAIAGVIGHREWLVHRASMRHRSDIAREAATSQSIARSLGTRRQELFAHAQGLRTALNPRNRWVSVLDDVAARAPRGVWLTGIELERGKPLLLRGTALQPEQAADFVTALSRSPLLDQVRLSFANEAELSRRHITQFGITAAVLGNDPDTKAVAPSKRPAAKSKSEEKAE